ncbi:hypothetical protein [Plantactinospora endophytica]|uniref:Heavy metal-binding domain-containing protein n=1 Tax=Plantactinospora endophytica TaxID=673535 RepID=A0ABQ4EFA0_9ACTN|nr:hypothetical protein [Plantactinospora endophytica]GIG93399.1 hypothetical protein Pen02_83350 [Plantactinospora endophytica]
MNTATKLGAFALGLATVFGAAYGAGQLAGPVRTAADSDNSTGSAHSTGHGTGNSGSAAPRLPGGLLVADRGYTLTGVPAAAGEFAFRIIGPDGRPVTGYDVEHDKRMHLIVARRDLSGFRHVHPEMDADGTWRVASPLGGPGSWRAFADFKPSGADALTLGLDVAVAGDFRPRPLPAPAPTAQVDGYRVRLDGSLTPGRTSELTLTVEHDGRPVTDLQPYLGAYGHLVALREGDLAYLHVHPDGEPGDGRTPSGPEITFFADVPSAGTYRLYLDFQHGDTVRTAEFTLTAGQPADPTSTGVPAGGATPDGPGPAAGGGTPDGPSPTAGTGDTEPGHGEPGHGHN